MNPTTPKNPATRHTTTSLRTATRVFYLLNFTRWFPVGFVVGIFVLIQTGRGLTIAEAMTAAATSGLVCFALELRIGLSDFDNYE